MNNNPNRDERRKEKTMTRRVTLGAFITMNLALTAQAAEPARQEPGGLINLALGCPVAVKTPYKAEPQSKGGFASSDLFKEKFADKASGIAGWGTGATPVLYVNPGLEELSLLNGAIKVPAQGVVVHPGQDTDVVVGWLSPVAGTVNVRAKVTHGHPSGGSDGVTWAIKRGTSVLAHGKVAPAGSAQVPAAPGKDADKLAAVPVAKGDTISLVIGRNGSYSADTTFIEFVIAETSGAKRVWDLAKDVVDNIQTGNPHADSLGNAGVWHFLAPKAAASTAGEDSLSTYAWSPDQLVDGVRVVGGYSCDPVYPGSNVDEWVEIDLGSDRLFHEIRVYPVRAHARNGEGAPNFPLDYTIETKADGGQYATVKTVTNQVNTGIAPVIMPVPNQKGRYVKIAVSRVSEPPPGEPTYALRLAEVEVMGPGTRAPQKAASAPPQQHWRLQTDDTAMTVTVMENRPAIWEWKNPRVDWNWLPAPAVIPLPTRVNVLKVKDHTAATWAFQEATVDATNGTKVTMRFTCNEEPKVQMKFSWWAAKGPGPIQYQEKVENETGNYVVLWPQRDHLNLSVKPEREVVLWRFHKDAGAPAVPKALFLDRLVDGAAHEAPITAGGQRGGFGFIPFVALDGGTHGVYCSGERQDGVISVAAEGRRPVTVSVKHPFGTDHTDVPGAKAELPPVYLGAYAGDMDDGCNGFKRWFFLHKVPENIRKDPTEPWIQFAAMWTRKPGWSHYQDVFAQGMKERLSDVGIESVCIDNGWWPDGKPDQWIGDPVRWPEGIAVAGKLAHENGFKLTLYFLLRGGGDYVKRLHEAMTAYGVDTYRSDFGAPDIALLDALAAIHPNFRYEHCDCGAPRKDFAMARRATVMFGIDIYDTLSNRKMFHVSSYCIHPAQLQSPTDVLSGPPAFALRSAMQGACDIGIGTHGGKLVMPSDYPAMIEPAKQNFALYKTRLRPLIREGNLYHISLRPDGVDWDGIQYHDPAKGTGAVMLFKPNNKVDTRRIVLKGLDRNKTYALAFQDRPDQNTRKSGADLMDQGFDVTLTGQNVSEIVWVETTPETDR